MTLIHSDGKSILLRSIRIWLASYWQLTPIKRALGHLLDIMGSASNYALPTSSPSSERRIMPTIHTYIHTCTHTHTHTHTHTCTHMCTHTHTRPVLSCRATATGVTWAPEGHQRGRWSMQPDHAGDGGANGTGKNTRIHE